MTSGSRRSRNYKDKRPMLAFGQIVLPIAALIAVGLLFVGVKLFFLTPPDRGGIEVFAQTGNLKAEDPVIAKPEEKSNDPIPPVQQTTPNQKIPMAGPVNPVRQTQSTRSETKPAIPNQQTAKPATKTDKQPAANQTSKPAAIQTSQPAQTTASAKWTVQIGAFSKEDGAKSLSDKAKKEGYPTSISTTNSSSGTKLYRVRINAGDTREKADILAAELEKKGYPVSVFPSQ